MCSTYLSCKLVVIVIFMFQLMWQLMHTYCSLLVSSAQDCPTPPAADPNGGVTYPNTMAGAVATYTCNVGYDLGADETLVCLVDGTWDPMTAPPCDRELKMVHAEENCQIF